MRPLLPLLGVVTTALTLTGCALLPGSGGSAHSKKTAADAPRALQICNAEAARWAIGKTNTEHNVNEARQRAGAHMARVLRPGQATTREFNAERLNLEVDATGRIIAARCG